MKQQPAPISRAWIIAGLIAGSLALAGPGAAAAQQGETRPAGGPEEVIRSQLRAFNANDVEAMVANIAVDFVYFAVDSDYSEPQLQGREAFHQSMTRYFRSVQGARAEIEEMFAVGEFIAVRERAYWLENGRERSQSSLAVYEVRDGLIHRVWYYPAVP